MRELLEGQPIISHRTVAHPPDEIGMLLQENVGDRQTKHRLTRAHSLCITRNPLLCNQSVEFVERVVCRKIPTLRLGLKLMASSPHQSRRDLLNSDSSSSGVF